MQQSVVFKNIEGKVTIFAQENLSFDSFIKILKTRLDKLYIKDDLLKSNVILDIRNISLDSKKILSIFDVFSEYETIYINKIIYNNSNEKNIVLHEGNIRAGEVKLFTTNTLLIGNINRDAKVIVNGNLYVIGKVSGYIEFKNINNRLLASNASSVHVKICTLSKNILEEKDNVVVEVNDNQITEGCFSDRRDRSYGKSNCSYIW